MQIHGYKMLWRDREKHDGGILFYENEKIPSKVLHLNSTHDDNEVILLEFSTKGLKWLCVGAYKAPSQNGKYFIENLPKNFDELTCQYDKTMFSEDFNLTTDNKNLKTFINTLNLECLIKKPTCFQSENPPCIDLILTNKNYLSIQRSLL